MNIYTNRQHKVQQEMKQRDRKQMIISDPLCIYYLTGHYVEVDERFSCLLFTQDNMYYFINTLFEVHDPTLNIIEFTDYDDPISLLCKYIDTSTLYVDKLFPAKYLVPIMHRISLEDIQVTNLIDILRMVKDDYEIDKMKEASRINDEAMLYLGTILKEGITEKEVRQHLLDFYTSKECSGFSFEPIISFGKNTSDTHHESDDTPLCKGDCIMLDIGCKKDMYCSDMTRMYFYGYTPDKKQQDIFNIVYEAYKQGLSLCKPGVKLKDIDKATRNYIEDKGYGDCFKHRTGHMCGLECHDYGEVSLSSDLIGQEGMIFSIEPTIMLEEYTIHYENLVLLTKDGYEELNKVTSKMMLVKE